MAVVGGYVKRNGDPVPNLKVVITDQRRRKELTYNTTEHGHFFIQGVSKGTNQIAVFDGRMREYFEEFYVEEGSKQGNLPDIELGE